MQCQECGTETTGDVCPKCGATIEGTPKWYAEGIAYLGEQKQLALAHELLEEGLTQHPSSALLWYNGGVLEEQMSNRDGAIRCYQEVIKLRPNNDKARMALERLLGRPVPRPTAPAPAPAPAPPPAAAAVLPPATVPQPAPPSTSAPAPVSAKAVEPVSSASATTHPDEAAVATRASAELDLQSLPTLTVVSASASDIESRSQRCVAISRITGIIFAVTFILLVAFMIFKAPALFFVDLLLFVASAIGFFVARSMIVTSNRRR